MAALTANIQYRVRGARKVALLAKNGETIYAGSYVALGGVGHADAGFAFKHAHDVVNVVAVGIAQQQVTGDGASVMVEVDLDDRIVEGLAVTGLAGDVTDVAKPVYLTDDNVFTLTAPTTGEERPKVGYVVQFVSSAGANVLLFGFTSLLSIHNATDGETPTS